MIAHHCPHCLGVASQTAGTVEVSAMMRCPHCRLVIGLGRCKTPAAAVLAGDQRRGGRAGVLAGSARRAEAEPGDPRSVTRDLRAVADVCAVKVGRLRMTDYSDALARGVVASGLAVVIATFGSWRLARIAATPDRLTAA